MKVNEFAKCIGLPASKIRYYDRNNITQSSRQEGNNYREFDQLDALDMYHAQLFRSFGMEVKDIAQTFRSNPWGKISNWMDNRMEQLEETIYLEQMKLHRLQEMKQYLLLGKTTESVKVWELPESYHVWTMGAEKERTPQATQAAAELIERMPFSYAALRISEDSLRKDDPYDMSIGLGILRENMSKCKLSSLKGLHGNQSGKYLAIYLEKENPFELSRKDLVPLYEEAEKQGLQLVGDAIGRFFFHYTENGKYLHGFTVGIKIKEKE